MLQTDTAKSRKNSFDDYVSKHLENKQLEWLIEEGKIRESVYFKGACGDRYTIYVATRRNKNVIDIGTVYNSYDHGTSLGNHIATLRGYVLEIHEKSHSWARNSSYYGLGYSFKQLMRQGVMSKSHPWKIRYCRSAYFCKLDDNAVTQRGGTIEFTPWKGMKIDIKKGTLVNKPNKKSIKFYHEAKEKDIIARKANYKANKNNKDALERYRKAGGDTSAARAGWVHDGSNRRWQQPEEGAGTENIDWSKIPIDDVFKHRNVTLRSNIMEHYGMDAILKTLKYEIVDEDTIDNRPYRLLDVVIPDLSSGQNHEQKGLYLEMLNPSTGESHFEGVANTGGWQGLKKATVKDALKWRDGDTEIIRDTTLLGDGATLDYINPVVLT